MQHKIGVGRCCCPDVKSCPLCENCLQVTIEGETYILEPNTFGGQTIPCTYYKLFGEPTGGTNANNLLHVMQSNCPPVSCGAGTTKVMWFTVECCPNKQLGATQARIRLFGQIYCTPDDEVVYPPTGGDIGVQIGALEFDETYDCDNLCRSENTDVFAVPSQPGDPPVCNIPIEICIVNCPTKPPTNCARDYPTSRSDENYELGAPVSTTQYNSNPNWGVFAVDKEFLDKVTQANSSLKFLGAQPPGDSNINFKYNLQWLAGNSDVGIGITARFAEPDVPTQLTATDPTGDTVLGAFDTGNTIGSQYDLALSRVSVNGDGTETWSGTITRNGVEIYSNQWSAVEQTERCRWISYLDTFGQIDFPADPNATWYVDRSISITQ